MLTAYIDESGTHSDSVCDIVSAVVANSKTWEYIENRWKRALVCFDVEAFHATDCNAFRGEFSGWDEDKRKKFYARLMRIINDEVKAVVAHGVIRQDFLNAKKQMPKVKRSSYEFCLERCLGNLSKYGLYRKTAKPIAVFIEAGQKNSSELIRIFGEAIRHPDIADRFKIASISIVPKKGIVPFQVADYIAYELYRFHSKRMSSHVLEFRPQVLGALMGKKTHGGISTYRDVCGWLSLPSWDEIE